MGFEVAVRHRALVRDPVAADMLSPESVAFEPFRVLRSKLQTLSGLGTPSDLGLVGATTGDGATTVSIGLAAALAEEPGQRVLLVEADLREPSVARRLGIAQAPGLSAWLADGGDEPPAVSYIQPWGFSLLAAGPSRPRVGERLGSDRMARLMAAAHACFDAVIVDCPPLSPWADTVALQEHLQGLVVVVRARHADREVVKAAVANLRPELVRGLVFNDHREVLTRLHRRRPPRRR